MRILAIETSCDETAISILECEGDETSATFRVLGNALLSQIDIHREFGGVFPMIAKREHAKNLVPMLHAALEDAKLLSSANNSPSSELEATLSELLSRETGLADALTAFLREYATPDIDAIAVTHGPGLEPALWVGVNFAKALALAWSKPLIGVNHMEGHLLSALATQVSADGRHFSITNIELPVLGLLISGGHTEIIAMCEWLSYRLIGQTRDDAVGEAYDKVARMLGLPYPGGPEVSKLAEKARAEAPGLRPGLKDSDQGRALNQGLGSLPRPMLKDATCDFSFSGLKTAVLYLVKDRDLSDEEKEDIALEFENAVADVLFAKTSRALLETEAKTVALGGGVSANTNIRRVFSERLAIDHSEVTLYLPEARFTTDNAIMIGIAGYFRALKQDFMQPESMVANGNLSLSTHEQI